MAKGDGGGMCVNYYAPLDVRIEEMKPVPGLNEGDVLVRVEACPICGTDVKSYLSETSG